MVVIARDCFRPEAKITVPNYLLRAETQAMPGDYNLENLLLIRVRILANLLKAYTKSATVRYNLAYSFIAHL